MIQATELLAELKRRGVTVQVEDGGTLFLKPKTALDEKLVAQIRQAKPEILGILRLYPYGKVLTFKNRTGLEIRLKMQGWDVIKCGDDLNCMYSGRLNIQ